MAPQNVNIWIAASDGNTEQVLYWISQDPSSVNSKDENGYTPIHAAASYGHLDLLRLLINSHGGDVNIQDDDGDTPLFTSESVDVAKCLIEELGADWGIRNFEGVSAVEAIEEEDQYPTVATYLRSLDDKATTRSIDPGSPPPGINLHVRSVDETVNDIEPVDDEFKRRIEEMAARPGEFTQDDLKELVTEVVHKHVLEPEERNVRPRD